ncbi:MAG: methionine gamma-lyase family protein [Oscillospiraceae bacterium]|nr:methionine gamma-lyase family protein [Oscillospiraceae bacterium]
MYQFDREIEELAAKAQADCSAVFERISETEEYCVRKVMAAFEHARLSEAHFAGSRGYGYGDIGRDTLDAIYAEIFGGKDGAAFVRHTFVNGTHALATALFGVLRPGDNFVSITGEVYDTLAQVIKGGAGSLWEYGINYREIDLLENGKPNYDAIPSAAKSAKMLYIQRSRGYSTREAFSIGEIEKMVSMAKNANPDVIIMVDNCYGEFVDKLEPTDVGADLMAGSLIKNPGGGIAETGGYIAGRPDLVELAACRHTVPGMGGEVGCSLGQTRGMMLGLFMAPTAVASALKTAAFAARLLELMGYETFPRYDDPRGDIIQTLVTRSPKAMEAFCKGIQGASPVDSYVTPEAWDMPGYDCKVIMAAGCFTSGSSIELSADGPMREPYAIYIQGGLTYASGKYGIMRAAQELKKVTQ